MTRNAETRTLSAEWLHRCNMSLSDARFNFGKHAKYLLGTTGRRRMSRRLQIPKRRRFAGDKKRSPQRPVVKATHGHMCTMAFSTKMSVSSDEILATRCNVDSRKSLIMPLMALYPTLVLGNGAPRPGLAGLTSHTRFRYLGTCLKAQLRTALKIFPLSIRYLVVRHARTSQKNTTSANKTRHTPRSTSSKVIRTEKRSGS